MKKTRTIRISLSLVIVVVFLFCFIIGKLVYIAVAPSVDGKDLQAFAKGRNTITETIMAQRGSIYDSSGGVLAQNVNSYTVIAYLDEERTTEADKPHHVVDKEMTAKALSPLINMTEKKILELLNLDLYQVELGPGGRNLTQLVKDQIEELELPGISFISSTKRYYPNSNFLSYTLGYAKTDENKNIIGELGLELFYDDSLTGTNGYRKYEADMYGYHIVNTNVDTKSAVSGNDIYLTVDSNVQLFTEQAISVLAQNRVEWASVSVMNAKTGAILGVASYPNFNPNKLDIKSYQDPFVTNAYEPGSTMKIFSWMAAMENGVYNGSEKFKSGALTIGKDRVTDWNNAGWGTITYDQGFMGSSNVGASYLSKKLGGAKLTDFYNLAGFGEKTGITLPNEHEGLVNFRYDIEIASASFGQGILITPVQMLQGLSIVANNGKMLKPYLVDKIVNPNTGEVVFQNTNEEAKQVVSEETASKIVELMRGVVAGGAPMSTGKSYYIKDYDIIGKTGTAQIASSSGGYLTGSVNYVRSFAGIFPGEDPEIIVYVVASKPMYSSVIPNVTKTLIEDVSTYLNIYGNKKESDDFEYKVESYVNKTTEDVLKELKKEKITPVVIGDGKTIISQYPKKDSIINNGEKVFLLTNSNVYKMVNMKYWSRSEVLSFANLINLNVKFDGYGYVNTTSLKPGAIIDPGVPLEVTLKEIYKEVVKSSEG